MYIDGKSKDYMICTCRNMTLGEAESFIHEHGITDLKTLCKEANIGNKCGACREMLDELIQINTCCTDEK